MSTHQKTIVVAIFHKNIYAIYQKSWVEQCLQSIFNQTHKNFTVYELNYGSDNLQLWPGSNFEQKPLENHVQAQNYLFDKITEQNQNAVIFNTNLDDVYMPTRIQEQLQSINQGFDLVSSNFEIVNHNLLHITTTEFHNKNILEEQNKNHNIICHPVIAVTHAFWQNNKYYSEERYRTHRDEDFELWKTAQKNQTKMIILPDVLCQYRVHDKQTGKNK